MAKYRARHARPHIARTSAVIGTCALTVAAAGSTMAVQAQPAVQAPPEPPGQPGPTVQQPVVRTVVDAARIYTVQRGDTLSHIAARFGQSLRSVEAANPQIRNPDLIFPGQTVSLSGGGAFTTAAEGPARDTDGDQDGSTSVIGHAPPAAGPIAAGPPAGSSSFQRCVIQRESGGNARAVNPSSGAGGLYQFLPSTWHALGFSGLPENASVATQNAAFAKEFALSGKSAWSPYDGC